MAIVIKDDEFGLIVKSARAILLDDIMVLTEECRGKSEHRGCMQLRQRLEELDFDILEARIALDFAGRRNR